jgi:diacylglycerol kinase family enzyme
VASDADLHAAVNDGVFEVTARPSEGFEFLRTLGLARSEPVREPQPEHFDLIQVTSAGAAPYLAANAVVAGAWAGRQRRRSRYKATMGARVLRGLASSVAVCNGQFVAPARWLAPRAHPADGRLAVLIDENRFLRARRLSRAMPLGEHVPTHAVHQLRPATLRLEGPRWSLEADGLPGRGRLPALFEVVPGALCLWV